MRNLKKILALVLALVMSLSLMATAGATNFKDDESITDTFSESVDVLAGLGVFGGYQDGEFKPQGEITRAEVAAIIYRIVTGQVGEDQSYKIYADYNTFTDVNSADWYAGYINFCANAEYVKGVGNGKFEPQGKVTGYQALAMILRAVGYDKNGEFTGSNWQVQTAATAQSLHITDKISSGTLGGNATREMVAEILCKSILVPQVKYTPAFGYRDYETDPAVKNETLAYSTFKMERLEGVVVANEYADLEAKVTLADGKTRIKTEDGAPVLNVTTDLTDVGESRYAYVIPTNVRNDYKMVTSELYDTGANVTKDTGAAKDTVKDLADAASVKTVAGETEYYLNFDPYSEWSSDWRIGYFITETEVMAMDGTNSTNKTSGEIWKFLSEKDSNGKLVNSSEEITASANDHYGENGWIRWIPRNTAFEEIDRKIIEYIFDNADLIANTNTTTDNGVIKRGEVYVGTQSMKDISDTASLNQFVKEYLNVDAAASIYSATKNGNWLKIIDNNNDGVVDYVLRTDCILDEITDSVTRTEATKFYYRYLSAQEPDVSINYLDDSEPTVGQVVVYAIIDGKAQAREAVSETATINSISYKNETATSTEGTEYEQSYIANETEMEELIVNMNEKTEYKLYKDYFGYVRAYTGPGNAYGLLTEVYPTYNYQSQLVQNRTLTAELTRAEDNGTVKEYNVLNSWNDNTGWNPFYNNETPRLTWDSVKGASVATRENYLQRAIAALTLNKNAKNSTAAYVDHEFDYDVETGCEIDDHTWTNVAKYSMGDEKNVNLYTASEYMYDKAGNQLYYAQNPDNNNKWTRYTQAGWINAVAGRDANAFQNGLANGDIRYVYAEDYVQIAVANIAAGQRHFPIAANYANSELSNSYVDATVDTQFYIVTKNGVQTFTGFSGLKAYSAKDNKINAIYAVAHNTKADNAERDYWVADVIVIELGELTSVYTSYSLAYYNDRKTSDQVRYVQTLNNKATGIEEELLPNAQTWPGQWNSSNYGFYGLTNEDKNADGTKTADITRVGRVYSDANKKNLIGYDYNDYGIYAGRVYRVNDLKTFVDTDLWGIGNENHKTSVDVSNIPMYAISATGARRIYSAELDLVGKDIIWMGSKTTPVYIVVLNPWSDWTTPSWLYAGPAGAHVEGTDKLWGNIYDEIIESQINPKSNKTTETVKVTFFGQDRTNVSYTEAVNFIKNNTVDGKLTKQIITIQNHDTVNPAKFDNATIGLTKVEDVPEDGSWSKSYIVVDGDNFTTYTFTIAKAEKSTVLTSTTMMENGFLKLPADVDLLAYINAFSYPDGAKTTWEFTRRGTNGDKITVTVDEDGKILSGATAEELKSMYTTGIEKITATVVPEKGESVVYNDVNNIPSHTVTLKDGITATYKKTDNTTATVTSGDKVKEGTTLTLKKTGVDLAGKITASTGMTSETTINEAKTEATATYTVGKADVTINFVDENAPTEKVLTIGTAPSGVSFKQGTQNKPAGAKVYANADGKATLTVEFAKTAAAGDYRIVINDGDKDTVLKTVKAGGAAKSDTVEVTLDKDYTLNVVKVEETAAKVSFAVVDANDGDPIANFRVIVKKGDVEETIRDTVSTIDVTGFETLTITVDGDYDIVDATGATVEDGVATYDNNNATGSVTVTLKVQEKKALTEAETKAEETVSDIKTAVGTAAFEALSSERKAAYNAAMEEMAEAKTETAVATAQAKALAALMNEEYDEDAEWSVLPAPTAAEIAQLKEDYASMGSVFSGDIVGMISNNAVTAVTRPAAAGETYPKTVYYPGEGMLVIDLSTAENFKAQVEADRTLWLALLDYSYGLSNTKLHLANTGFGYTFDGDTDGSPAVANGTPEIFYERLIATSGLRPNLSADETPNKVVFLADLDAGVFPVTDAGQLESTITGSWASHIFDATAITAELAK